LLEENKSFGVEVESHLVNHSVTGEAVQFGRSDGRPNLARNLLGFLRLLEGDLPSGRYAAADLVPAVIEAA
jgi:hypothetical protein